jgi:carboxypeptidase C (cathepsin A)
MDDCATAWNYFMQNLYTLYPEFQGKDFYFAGESYAGKYLPRYSWGMLQENK